ncbi:MAG: enoyl-ACP reductase [Burkholderiales bacterium]|nr:enoyl-ACP reductase [Burkholderiales bacterium]
MPIMLLRDKKILLTGVLSNRSIAYGIGQALKREGATLALTYAGEAMRERVEKLAPELGAALVMSMDVTRQEEIDVVFDRLKQEWGALDGAVHSIGYAPREAIAGDFLEGLSWPAFSTAMEISAYSFAAMGKAARPLMQGRNASLITLTYLGSVRAVPNYNTMGVAKAALESITRYMAACLGPEGIRVNAISAGPIKTLAASGIAGFSKMLKGFAQVAPLRRNVTIEDVGNVAAFLLSDWASAMTGEVLYVDCGYSHVAAGLEESSEKSAP